MCTSYTSQNKLSQARESNLPKHVYHEERDSTAYIIFFPQHGALQSPVQTIGAGRGIRLNNLLPGLD
jgi:hypothetical protein